MNFDLLYIHGTVQHEQKHPHSLHKQSCKWIYALVKYRQMHAMLQKKKNPTKGCDFVFAFNWLFTYLTQVIDVILKFYSLHS